MLLDVGSTTLKLGAAVRASNFHLLCWCLAVL
jgi:hypothetical protein